MAKRTAARRLARKRFDEMKSRAGRLHPEDLRSIYAFLLDDMRNAWVAYHAGAPWMSDMASAAIALRGMDADIGHLQDDNARLRARLRAEVARYEKRWDELRAWVAPEGWQHGTCDHGSCDGCTVAAIADKMDALARGDGASS